MSAVVLPFADPNLRRRIEREVAAEHAANVRHMSTTLDLLMAGIEAKGGVYIDMLDRFLNAIQPELSAMPPEVAMRVHEAWCLLDGRRA